MVESAGEEANSSALRTTPIHQPVIAAIDFVPGFWVVSGTGLGAQINRAVGERFRETVARLPKGEVGVYAAAYAAGPHLALLAGGPPSAVPMADAITAADVNPSYWVVFSGRPNERIVQVDGGTAIDVLEWARSEAHPANRMLLFVVMTLGADKRLCLIDWDGLAPGEAVEEAGAVLLSGPQAPDLTLPALKQATTRLVTRRPASRLSP